MPRTEDKQSLSPDIRVFLQDKAGKYLAGKAGTWFFTEERSVAAVFYYSADHVPEQLERLQQAHGVELESVPVPLTEIYESCDRCKELFMPYMVLFDGKRFLCADCRNRFPVRPTVRNKGP